MQNIEPGVWTGSKDTSRIFKHDKMPHFIDYGVSSSATRSLTYCGRGEKCEQMTQENRECVTIKPNVSLMEKFSCVMSYFLATKI